MQNLNNQVLESNCPDPLLQSAFPPPLTDQQLKGNKIAKNGKNKSTNIHKRSKKKSVDNKKNDSGKARSHLLDAFAWSTVEKEMKGLKKEYNEEIANIIPKKEECVAFYSREIIDKNRNPFVPCLDTSRCAIFCAPPSESYIHANYISSLDSPKRFIATQAPLDNTVLDFWKLVLQEKVQNIIMLCNFKEKNVSKCAEYFPLEIEKFKSIGNFKIMLLNKYPARADENIMCYTINISCFKIDHSVKIYHWINWPETGHPTVSGTAVTLYAGVYKSNTPILVHCSSGIRRTGIWLMVALFMDVINEGKIENDSTLKLAKKLRSERAGAIVSDIDYAFIHRLIFQQLLNKHIISSSQRLLEFFDDYEADAKKAKKVEKNKNTNLTTGNGEVNSPRTSVPGFSPTT